MQINVTLIHSHNVKPQRHCGTTSKLTKRYSILLSSLATGMLPRQDIAFPRWTAMEMRWCKKAVSLGSPVTLVILRPNSLINWRPSALHEPIVSTATGAMWKWLASWLYFCSLIEAACSAATPAFDAPAPTWEGASVSGIVASQTRHLPLDQGIWVIPSGRRPDPATRPLGSLVAGIFALSRAR